ncbi:MAG: 2-isopropylmalate synthase, partial [Proteobacteria bacterium]|nr:2-isopropylmalate synthase [Pseudomonadota bacterium]
DFSDINRVIDVYERCTRLPVHPRHPYAGELVYTAFSGSHQDAINKGMAAFEQSEDGIWAVPYLPIDPEDVGRTYESIIRINSQSGKGGIAYIMDREFGFKLPREMQREFAAIIQKAADEAPGELPTGMIYSTFEKEYLLADRCYELGSFDVLKRNIDRQDNLSTAEVEAVIRMDGGEAKIKAVGNGPLDAFCRALRDELGLSFTLQAYHQHALTGGSSSRAVSYILIHDAQEREFWGAGIDTDIIVASIKALLSGLNRACTIS